MSQQAQWQNIQACVFDAYGTLFDVHSAISSQRERLGKEADAISLLWRTKQLEYTWLRSLMQKHADFWQVTRDALDYAFATFKISDNRLRDDLMAAYLQLDCYPEVPDALLRLKQSGRLGIAILSNGSPRMLEAAVKSAGISDFIDAILSVEEVGVYKPDPRVYQLAVSRLALPPERISFQSSNAWDVAGAASFGLRVAWINRFQQQPEQLPAKVDAELRSLSELVSLLGVESPQ